MSLLTTLVDTLNVVVIEPAGIVTVVGTSALKLDDAKDTLVPPDGAGPEIINVPVVEVPPLTGELDQDTCTGMGA